MAANAQPGRHLPKMTAASAMYPRPLVMFSAKLPDEPDREERAAERRQDAGGDHGRVPNAVDRDADRVGGLGMLADGADAQADGSLEQDDVGRG